MKKIILRKNLLAQDRGFCDLINLTSGEDYTRKELVNLFGYKKLMKELLDEDIGEYDNIRGSVLYKNYKDFLKSNENENENFVKIYKLNSKYGVKIGAHIDLYHLIPNKDYLKIVPWNYAYGQLYIGDAWWESDEEIIENIQKLNIIEFYEYYKGF